MPTITEQMIEASKELRDKVGRLKFKPPVTYVYSPLDYAWPAHEAYLRQYGNNRKRVVFLGMNPGPWGMVQTGIPFGEVKTVRDWMKIKAPIGKAERDYVKRPVDGFDCRRSEVSGQRLWGLFAKRFGSPENFFADHFVTNYCPLAFFDPEGCNLTPDKLPVSQAGFLFIACDEHLRRVTESLQPDWLIGIGDFAEKRARRVFPDSRWKIGKILHPSPASPLANKDWAKCATEQLQVLRVW
ncbi:MAG: single-stranded DNA-binding protein [Verrucomicrobia bacterium]|nr:MAG: single-stranded DNA-binding protein [Verrucomicrobiota bacterium]